MLSLGTLKRRLRAMPMLAVLLFFVAGIVAYGYFDVPIWLLCALLPVLIVVVWCTRHSAVAHLYAGALVALCGYLACEVQRSDSDISDRTPVEMVVSVEGRVRGTNTFRQADGRIEAWNDGDGWHSANDRVVMVAKRCSLAQGTRLRLYGALYRYTQPDNRFEKFMRSRGYVGRIFMDGTAVLDETSHEVEGLRSYALRNIGRVVVDSAAHSTVEAMVAGERGAMPESLTKAYSHTGMTHILAVSGLHLGIVAILLTTLLQFMVLLRNGIWWRNVAAMVAMWLFVVVSGASASVVRAAVMLSMLMLAASSARNYNPLNALAATLFVMLAYNSSMLYDISFQLSATAVFGILVWAVPLMQRVRLRGGLLRWLISSMAVGVVATLWVMPIVSHTFGIVSFVGVVITPIVVVTAYPVIAFGLLAVVLPAPLNTPFIAVAEWFASWQNSIVEGGEMLPYAYMEYRMSEGTVVAYYVVFMIITVAVWSSKRDNRITLRKTDEYI